MWLWNFLCEAVDHVGPPLHHLATLLPCCRPHARPSVRGQATSRSSLRRSPPHAGSSTLYGADMADLRKDCATGAQALEEKYRERERQNAEAVVAAWEERDRALASATDLSDELGRVRIEAEHTLRELSGTRGDSCNAVRAELSTCTSLLERSAELLARGSKLAEQTAIEKDSVTQMLMQ